MRNRLILTIACLWLACSAFGQSTTITGVVKDLSLALVTSGKVVFTLKPSVDTTISGNARFTPGAPVTCYIQSDGTLKNAAQTAACIVTTNTSLTPAGTSYRVDICPYMACASSFNFYAINASYDISTIVPTPTTGPAQNFADVFSNQTVAGNKTFTGVSSFTGAVAGAIALQTVTLQLLEGIAYVDSRLSRGGVDIGDEINKAYAALPANGGTIFIAGNASNYNFSTPIIFNTVGKVVSLIGATSGAVTLNWTGSSSGTAFVINWGGNSTINGHPGVISNFALCNAVCNISGASSSTVGMNIGSGPNFPTQGVVVQNVALQGWGTGLIDFGFDVHIIDPVILNNGIGVNNTGGSPMWIDHGLISQNTLEQVLLSGGATDNDINTTDIETNLGSLGFAAKGIVLTGAAISLTLTAVHLEANGVGSTGQLIYNSGSQNTVTLDSGLMVYDANVGTVPEFVNFNSDYLKIDGTAMTLIPTGNTLTNGLVNSTGFATIRMCPRLGNSLLPLVMGIGNPSVMFCTTKLATSPAVFKLKHTRVQIDDAGTCVLSAGACPAQNLQSPYTTAPLCWVTWDKNVAGSVTGILGYTSTVAGGSGGVASVTPTDSVGGDGGTVTYTCFDSGN